MTKISKNIIISGLLVAVFAVVFLIPNITRTALVLTRAVLVRTPNKTILDNLATTSPTPELQADGQTIPLSYTDDTNQESLIIRSDKSDYTGNSGSDVYFSVTNTNKIDESAILLFYFPGQFIPNRNDLPGTGPATVTSLEQRVGDTWQKREFFAKNIKIDENTLSKAIAKRKPIPEDFEVKAGAQIEVPAGQTVYFKSKISFRSTDGGEFWIEALGKNGSYDLLHRTYTGTRYNPR